MKLVLVDADKISAIEADEKLILADLAGIKTDVDATEAALASALAKIAAGSTSADPATAALLDSINSDLINAHVSASATKNVLEAALTPAGSPPVAAAS